MEQLDLARTVGALETGSMEAIPMEVLSSLSPRRQKAKEAAMRTMRGGLGLGKTMNHLDEDHGASELKGRVVRYVNARADHPKDAGQWEPIQVDTVAEASELVAILNSVPATGSVGNLCSKATNSELQKRNVSEMSPAGSLTPVY